MQQLARSHRKQGALTQLGWISRADGTVTQQQVRTRAGYEDAVWTIVDTGEDVYLTDNPNPLGPTLHWTENEALSDAHARLTSQIHSLLSNRDVIEHRLDDLVEGQDD